MRGVRHLWRWATGYVLAGGLVACALLALAPAIGQAFGRLAGGLALACGAVGVAGALLGLYSALREYRRWAQFEQRAAAERTKPLRSQSGWMRVGPLGATTRRMP